jgi:hypothetical protein
MRRLRELNKYRDKQWERRLAGSPGDDFGGCFKVPGNGATLHVLASSGEGLDHVSVSTDLPRCPSWTEMDKIKRLFFKPEEVAFQLHVPIAEHISVHNYCLHIWRPHEVAIPIPPAWMVA